MDNELVAVTGASGRVGRRLALRLAAEGRPQRLVVRDAARAPSLPGTETEVAVSPGYADSAAMRAAFEGVGTVFLVSAHESPERVAEHRAAVDAAADAGVERIVYLSFVGAAPGATFTFARDHWATEQHIRASGLRFTFLRDNLYHAIFPDMVGPDDVIRGPAGDGRVASVAHDDVADVATAVLLDADEHAHDGATYDVTGPTALTFHQVAQILTAAVGRPIRYEAETVEQAYASRASYGAPAWEVDGWVTSYTAVAAGQQDVVTPTVAHFASRPAQSLTDWLRLNPAGWARLRR